MPSRGKTLRPHLLRRRAAVTGSRSKATEIPDTRGNTNNPATWAGTATVIVVVALAVPGVRELGENLAVAPAGSPPAEKLMEFGKLLLFGLTVIS
jgi:hypothetical protein